MLPKIDEIKANKMYKIISKKIYPTSPCEGYSVNEYET